MFDFLCMSRLFSSIDQLAEVVRHHIESGAKLQDELVLVGNVLNYCIVFCWTFFYIPKVYNYRVATVG